MAKTIATVGGIALKPGVSLNRRLYTRPMIAAAVADAQARIAAGESMAVRDGVDGHEPLVQLTHHAAEDDSTRIVGRITGMSVDEDGNARFTAALADTPHGRTIAALADTSDGEPAFLKGVSIRGAWTGTVRKVKADDGRPAETAQGVTLAGLDYTRAPGVTGAALDTFAWAKRDGQSETTERVLIYESVPEASVTAITEETVPAEEAEPPVPVIPGTLAEALAAVHAAPHLLENGICLTCERVAEAAMPMGKRTTSAGPGGPFADPGYQADKKPRYQLDTKAHAKAAWAYVSMPKNAKAYTAQQLKRIKGKIKGALKRFGVTISAESAGWTTDAPVYVTEALAEDYGDAGMCGSWSISAANGPVNICLSSYGMDPEDLDVILRAAADAACKALAALDPDMDGDIDLPGAAASDTDHDGGESAPGGDDPETDPAAGLAATTQESEVPAMAETTTTAAEASPAAVPDKDVIAEAVSAALAKADADRRARKAAKKAAQATETAPAAPAAAVTETDDERVARLVETRLAARLAEEKIQAQAAETEDERVNRLVETKMVTERQKLAESGLGTGRKGLTTGAVNENNAPSITGGGVPELNQHGMPKSFPDKPLHEFSIDELRANGAPLLTGHVLGARAALLG